MKLRHFFLVQLAAIFFPSMKYKIMVHPKIWGAFDVMKRDPSDVRELASNLRKMKFLGFWLRWKSVTSENSGEDEEGCGKAFSLDSPQFQTTRSSCHSLIFHLSPHSARNKANVHRNFIRANLLNRDLIKWSFSSLYLMHSHPLATQSQNSQTGKAAKPFLMQI